MERLQSTGEFIKKAGLVTLIGFLVIVLAGPFMAVAGFMLPFALVGLLVYVPYRMIVAGKDKGWQGVRETGEGMVQGIAKPAAEVRQVLAGPGRALFTVLAVPFWIAGRGLALLGFVLRTVFGTIGFALRLILPTLAGGILGAALGVIGGMEHQDAEVRVPAAAVIGASIGLLAGAWRTKPVTKVIVVHGPQVAQPA